MVHYRVAGQCPISVSLHFRFGESRSRKDSVNNGWFRSVCWSNRGRVRRGRGLRAAREDLRWRRSQPGAIQPVRAHRSGTKVITGDPDPEMICTSHVERSNLSMRTFLRRMTRLCLGFSKKLENLKAAVSLYFAHYNFCRIHGTLRVTPAMEAGLTNHVWSLQELLTPV